MHWGKQSETPKAATNGLPEDFVHGSTLALWRPPQIVSCGEPIVNRNPGAFVYVPLVLPQLAVWSEGRPLSGSVVYELALVSGRAPGIGLLALGVVGESLPDELPVLSLELQLIMPPGGAAERADSSCGHDDQNLGFCHRNPAMVPYFSGACLPAQCAEESPDCDL